MAPFVLFGPTPTSGPARLRASLCNGGRRRRAALPIRCQTAAMRRSAVSWLAPLGVALLVLVILLVVGLASSREGDETPTSVDPTPAGSSSSSPAETPVETPSQVATPSAAPSVDITKPAKDAAKDGFAPMVPSEVPPGWVATDAAYTPGTGSRGPVWRLSFQLPDGSVVVMTQSELGLAGAVERYLGAGAERSGRVDLRKFGTGYWFAYTVPEGAGIAKQLPTDTSVVIAAPSVDDAVILAQQLLTFEDYDSPEAG